MIGNTYPKKIIFSSYDDIRNPFYAGGGATAIHEVAKGLSRYFDVTVITGNYKGAKSGDINNVIYKRIGPAFLGPKLSQFIFPFILLFYLNREEFDLWIENFTPPFSTSFLPLFTRKPVIGLVHMLSSQDMERKYKLPFHLLENIGLKMYNNLIVTSDEFKKKVKNINKNTEIAVIPNGVNIPWESKKFRTRQYLLYIGRIEFDQKGLDLLISAYAAISLKIKAKLVIAGSGSNKDSQLLEESIRKHQLQNKVVLLGRVQGKQKEELFRECKLVVIPSRFETFSMVALEAMAYRKPIVSFAIEGLKWIPKNCVLKAKPYDTKQLGEKILKLLEDKKLKRKMISTARRVIGQYSWEASVARYQRVVSKVLHLAYDK